MLTSSFIKLHYHHAVSFYRRVISVVHHKLIYFIDIHRPPPKLAVINVPPSSALVTSAHE